MAAAFEIHLTGTTNARGELKIQTRNFGTWRLDDSQQLDVTYAFLDCLDAKEKEPPKDSHGFQFKQSSQLGTTGPGHQVILGEPGSCKQGTHKRLFESAGTSKRVRHHQ
jgi:hypothetical protein